MQPSVKRDIAYGSHPLQRFDLHVADQKAPVVLLIHGGGFVMGRKEDFEIPAQLFCKAGFNVINISHRLVAGNWFPQQSNSGEVIRIADQIHDVDTALRLFCRRAAEWGLSKDALFIAGHSAGAILAMLYLLGDGRDEGLIAAGNWAGVTDLSPSSIFSGAFVQPWQEQPLQALYNPMFDYSTLAGSRDARLISPYWLADRYGGLPVISVYPERNVLLGLPGEALFGLNQTKRFHALLRSQKVTEKFVLFRGCDHQFQGCGDDAWQRCVEETAAFFKSL